MQIILPFQWDKKSVNISILEMPENPYIVPTITGAKTMTREEIILRIESAIYDKDWAAIELLLDDLQIEDNTGAGYTQYEDEDYPED